MPESGYGEGRDDESGDEQRRLGVAQHGGEQSTADTAATDAAVDPPQQRDARPVDPATELGQQRGEHREGAQDGDGHDDDGAGGQRRERRVVHDVEAGHRHDDGEARDDDRVPRGRRGDLDGVDGAVAALSLLALALEVEQRVVHADGHADQQDHARHRRLARHEIGDRRVDADGDEDTGDRQQHGDPGRDERAERQQHDDEGDREAQPLGRGEVLAHALVDRVVERQVARLGHVQGRVVTLHVRGDPFQGRRVGLLVLVAGEADRDQHRVAVLGPDRPAHRRDAVDVGHLPAYVDRRSLRLGGVELTGLRCDEDVLGVRSVEAGVGDDLVGAAGLAEPVVGVGGGLGRDEAARRHRGGDEGDPDQERAPRVGGAPARGPQRNGPAVGA